MSRISDRAPPIGPAQISGGGEARRTEGPRDTGPLERAAGFGDVTVTIGEGRHRPARTGGFDAGASRIFSGLADGASRPANEATRDFAAFKADAKGFVASLASKAGD